MHLASFTGLSGALDEILDAREVLASGIRSRSWLTFAESSPGAGHSVCHHPFSPYSDRMQWDLLIVPALLRKTLRHGETDDLPKVTELGRSTLRI